MNQPSLNLSDGDISYVLGDREKKMGLQALLVSDKV